MFCSFCDQVTVLPFTIYKVSICEIIWFSKRLIAQSNISSCFLTRLNQLHKFPRAGSGAKRKLRAQKIGCDEIKFVQACDDNDLFCGMIENGWMNE